VKCALLIYLFHEDRNVRNANIFFSSVPNYCVWYCWTLIVLFLVRAKLLCMVWLNLNRPCMSSCEINFCSISCHEFWNTVSENIQIGIFFIRGRFLVSKYMRGNWKMFPTLSLSFSYRWGKCGAWGEGLSVMTEAEREFPRVSELAKMRKGTFREICDR
jgi:hypothetical protein